MVNPAPTQNRPAATWQEAYKALDPMIPLMPGDPWLCRDLFGDFLDTLREKLLLNCQSNRKLLLSGHVGCGKSTLLNVLAAEQDITQKFLVVRLSIKEFVDPNVIDHIDVLLALVLSTVEAARAAKVKFDTKMTKRIRTLALELAGIVERVKTKGTARKAKLEAEVGAGLPKMLSWLRAGFTANYQLQSELRNEVREFYRPRIGDLLDSIDTLFSSIKAGLKGRELLVLVDDTDKPRPPSKARELFYDYGEHLARPKTNIVYTVDTSVSCYREFAAIRAKFGDEEFFPAVRVADPGGNDDNGKLATLCGLLHRRVTSRLLDDNQATELARLSGGVARELVRLAREAFFSARGRVTADDVKAAAVDVRNSSNLKAPDVSVLKKVLANPHWLPANTEEDETFFSLLALPALFQYRNGVDKWYRPYPVFVPWLRLLP